MYNFPKPLKTMLRDEIEEIIKSEQIDRTRFREFDKKRYGEIINKFYYAFFDYKKYSTIDLSYLWLKVRDDIDCKILCGMNNIRNWNEYISRIRDYISESSKMYFFILDNGFVYEGYIPEIQRVVLSSTGFLNDFYIVSKKFDMALVHNDDGECMSMLTNKSSSPSA